MIDSIDVVDLRFFSTCVHMVGMIWATISHCPIIKLEYYLSKGFGSTVDVFFVSPNELEHVVFDFIPKFFGNTNQSTFQVSFHIVHLSSSVGCVLVRNISHFSWWIFYPFRFKTSLMFCLFKVIAFFFSDSTILKWPCFTTIWGICLSYVQQPNRIKVRESELSKSPPNN